MSPVDCPELGAVPVEILLPVPFPILNSEVVVPLKLPNIAILSFSAPVQKL
jgi:hypothetical protein